MHLVKIKSSDSRRENKRVQDAFSFRREKTIFHVYKNGAQIFDRYSRFPEREREREGPSHAARHGN